MKKTEKASDDINPLLIIIVAFHATQKVLGVIFTTQKLKQFLTRFDTIPDGESSDILSQNGFSGILYHTFNNKIKKEFKNCSSDTRSHEPLNGKLYRTSFLAI